MSGTEGRVMSEKAGKIQRKQHRRLLDQFGLTEAEQLQAFDLFKQQKSLQAQSVSGSAVRPVLPGFNPSIDNRQMAELKQQARELEIRSGHYESWEILQFGDYIAAEQKSMFEHQTAPDLVGYVDLHMQLLHRMTMIAGAVQATGDRDLWTETKDIPPLRVYAYTEKDAGELGDLLIQINIVAERLELLPLPFTGSVKVFIVGIRNLLNDEIDNGQSLRKAAADFKSLDASFIRFLALIPKPGIKSSKVIDRLCDRAKKYQQAGEDWGAVFDHVVEELAKIEGRDDQEKEEYEYTATWSAEALRKASATRQKKVVARTN